MTAVTVHHVIDAAPGLPGNAAALVLAHPLGATHAMWDKQVTALSSRFRVIRYDTRGHGASPVPRGPYSIDDLTDDLLALLAQLGLERVHVAGLSLGGMTALRLAAREPRRVGRLVVLCTSARLDPRDAWRERAAAVRAAGTGAVAAGVASRWYTASWREAHPDLTAAAESVIRQTPAEGYAGCCETIAAMDLTGDLASITAPTLAIAGAEDPATPPPHLERIAAGVPDGRMVTVPHAAHLASDEQPEIVTQAILAHLETAR